MYCTNQTEPDPQHPGQKRLIWRHMRVGCVYWQDDQERWHKRVVWGQEEDFLSFGTSLYRLACRCGYRLACRGGYRQAREKIFAADGGQWCWTIHQKYFADAWGILDWYHASEHVWACGKALYPEKDEVRAWVDEALDSLIHYVQPRLDRTDSPTYRSNGWQIGTEMIESTAKQLVEIRLKGPGMHWSRHGATAITALRAQDLNGVWHKFWNTLALAP